MAKIKEVSVASVVGERVKALRVQQGITQRELAIVTGIDSTAISRVECGKSVSLRNLQRIARGLGVNPSELLP